MGNSTSRSQVWQYKVEPSLKCRIKDSFVQWQIKGPDGPLSYGMRLKTSESAQKVTFPPLLLASARMYVSPGPRSASSLRDCVHLHPVRHSFWTP